MTGLVLPGRRGRADGEWWPWAATALRLVLAGVLALAGVPKLPDPAESVRAVRAFRLLPEAVVPRSATACRSWRSRSRCCSSSGG